MWRIFYDDDSTFSGDPYDAPRQGVVCIVQDSRILWYHDTYCWQDGCWVEHDRLGCERYLDSEKHPVRLVGYCLPTETFRAIFEKAKEYKKAGG